MAQIREYLSRIRLTYRRTNNLTKIVVAVAIVVCMATLLTLRLSTASLLDRTEDLRQQAGALEHDNQELNEKISELGSQKSTVEIAEEELGLVQPGTVQLKPTEP